MEPTTHRLVSRTPIFAGLPEPDRQRLAGYSVPLGFVAGETLLATGGPPCRILALIDGAAAEDGSAAGHRPQPYVTGDLIGIEAVLEHAPAHAAVRATADGTALAIAAAPFLDHLATRFDLLLGLLAATSARLRRTVHGITEIKLRSTTHRLARYLVELAGTRGRADLPGPRRLILPCEKQTLAERLGMQPESLSRAFAKLRPLGVSTGRDDAVRIADLPALIRFCEGPDNAGPL